MVDLFGIKKESETAPASAPSAQRASGAGQKLWGALLLADSALVIVFGGAVAAKLYQHFNAAATVVPIPAAHHRPGRPLLPPATATAAAKPAAAQPAPAAATPQPPAKIAAPASGGSHIAKPSLLAEPVRGREAPKPRTASAGEPAPQAAAAAKPAEPAKPGEKRHSMPIEFKLAAPRARSVHLAGAFIVRGGRREMTRQDDGTWTLTLYLLPGCNYRYWFVVDGKKTLDPESRQVERGASVLALP